MKTTTLWKYVRQPTKSDIRWLHTLVLVAILFIAGDCSGVYAWQARKLDLHFAWLSYCTPVLACLLYLGTGLLLRRTPVKPVCWVIAYGVAALISVFPSWNVSTFTQPIPTTRFLEPQERTGLATNFDHPYIEKRTTGAGQVILINRIYKTSTVVEYLESIHAYRSETN